MTMQAYGWLYDDTEQETRGRLIFESNHKIEFSNSGSNSDSGIFFNKGIKKV
jgi:hypothetical protein